MLYYAKHTGAQPEGGTGHSPPLEVWQAICKSANLIIGEMQI